MPEQNIWESLNLSEENLKNSYDYLISQVENFKTATKGELNLEIEVTPTTSAGKVKRQMTIYYLYVVAPKLGNFRKKLLHIAEFDDQGRFPVMIWNYIEDKGIQNISEEELLDTLKEILSHPRIIGVIENLYKQSLESKKNNS